MGLTEEEFLDKELSSLNIPKSLDTVGDVRFFIFINRFETGFWNIITIRKLYERIGISTKNLSTKEVFKKFYKL